ncbi:MAG: hypothetical protein ACJ72N_22725 [Labedaea sp.]
MIDVPAVNGGGLILAQFCRDLARVAAQLAIDLDRRPKSVDRADTSPRHPLREGECGE